MPSIISRGAGSIKALGFFTPATSTLQTVNFTSSGTWVAPSSVTNVVSLSGEGADGSATSTGTSGPLFSAAALPYSAGSNPPFAQWSDLYNAAVASRNVFSATVGGAGPSSVNDAYRLYIYPSNYWDVAGYNTGDYSSLTITSVSGLQQAGTFATPTSGPIYYSGLGPGSNGWYFEVNYSTGGFVGADSTALGKTFPGGSYGPASPVTYTNVAVTPGTSYTINVASGGFVQIQYYL